MAVLQVVAGIALFLVLAWLALWTITRVSYLRWAMLHQRLYGWWPSRRDLIDRR